MSDFEELKNKFQKVHSVASTRIEGTYFLDLSLNNLLATQENVTKLGTILQSMASQAGLSIRGLPAIDSDEVKKQIFIHARDQLGCEKYRDLLQHVAKGNFPSELIQRGLGANVFQNLDSAEAILMGYPELAKIEIEIQSDAGKTLARCQELINSDRLELVKKLARDNFERRRLLGNSE